MPLTTDDVDYIRTLIRRKTGNVWSENQAYLIESRLRDVATDSGFGSVEELVAELRRRPATYEKKVAESVVVNETRFFRDADLFHVLETEVLPELIEARRREKRLTIWSAACSTGQEPYSIAMLIAEKFPELADWNIRITACDINDSVIEKTRSGCYTQFEVNRGLPVRMLAKYFERDGMLWRVKDCIRNQVVARKHNLLEPMPVYSVDLSLVRNVLIYFDDANKTDILSRVARATSRDGFVLLGGGETLLGLDVPLQSDRRGTITTYRPGSGEVSAGKQTVPPVSPSRVNPASNAAPMTRPFPPR